MELQPQDKTLQSSPASPKMDALDGNVVESSKLEQDSCHHDLALWNIDATSTEPIGEMTVSVPMQGSD